MNEAPLPKIGDVLNYILLFAHETTTRDEGASLHGRRSRSSAPLRPGRADDNAGRAIFWDADCSTGRDLTRQFAPSARVVVEETNSFTWLGYDLRPLVATGDTRLGRMPPGFTKVMIDAVRRASEVDRD